MRRLNENENPIKKVLFLGYNESQSELIRALIIKNCLVDHTDEKIDGISGYDFVVSYGYGHILKPNVIEDLGCPIFNLHISYLPYNRGAHPNFWSFFDNSPAGVTVHLIDDGVDTGPIVSQRYVNFKKEEDTFLKTYKTLVGEMESLFLDCVDSILTDKWTAKKQRGIGTHHYVRDLPSNFAGWNSNIEKEIAKLNQEGLKYE